MSLLHEPPVFSLISTLKVLQSSSSVMAAKVTEMNAKRAEVCERRRLTRVLGVMAEYLNGSSQ